MTEKVAYLEGLRGLAAFFVFLGHYIPLYIRIPLLLSLAYTVRDSCVCIFFVLSGFVLTYSFFTTCDNEILVSGAVRRYIRLLIPILFLNLILFILIYPGLGNIFDLRILSDMTSTTFLQIFIQGPFAYSPEVNQYTGILWTIGIEFIGSLIVFAFAALFGKLRNRAVFYLAALLVFLNTYYLAFVLGMILADLSQNPPLFSTHFRKPVIIAVALAAAIILLLYPLDILDIGMYSNISVLSTIIAGAPPLVGISIFLGGGTLRPGDFFHILGAFILLSALLNCIILKVALSARVPVFLGKISFSLYLIHMLVIYEFSALLMGTFIYEPLTPVNGTFILILTIPVLVFTSYLMYKFIDHPGTILSKKIYQCFFRNIPGSYPSIRNRLQ